MMRYTRPKVAHLSRLVVDDLLWYVHESNFCDRRSHSPPQMRNDLLCADLAASVNPLDRVNAMV